MLARLRSHPVVLDRTWDLVLVVAAVEGIPRIAGLLAGTLVPALEWLDPDRAALAVTIHHLWQLALTLLAMLLVDRRRGLAGWGFTLRDARVSLRWAASFMLIFAVITCVAVPLQMVGGAAAQLLPYPVRPANVLWSLGFQGLVSGTAEEPLFRAFVMVVLARSWPATLRVGRFAISLPGLVAALLFAYGHIGIRWYPFAIWQLFPVQVLTAFALGLAYAAIFARTRSLLAPILAHNAANVLVVLTALVTHAVLNA